MTYGFDSHTHYPSKSPSAKNQALGDFSFSWIGPKMYQKMYQLCRYSPMYTMQPPPSSRRQHPLMNEFTYYFAF